MWKTFKNVLGMKNLHIKNLFKDKVKLFGDKEVIIIIFIGVKTS